MNEDLNLIFHDEAQLLDWGESRAAGAWIKVRLPDAEALEPFRGMDTSTLKKTGHIFNLTITQGDIVPAEETKPRPYGEQAKALKLSGFFRNPTIWPLIGTDEEFLAWIRTQPSAFSGDYNDYSLDGRSIAAHVRRVGNGAGISVKPPYSAIPLTNEEHTGQHQKGESDLAPRAWWDKKRIEYVERWGWETLKATLGYESWAEVPPQHLKTWASANGVDHLLPEVYR